MGHLSSLKVTRLLLCALVLLCVAKTLEAKLNMIGMTTPAERGPMQLTLGRRAKRSSDDSDDEDDDEDDDGRYVEPSYDSYDGMCLDVKPSAWTLSNMYRDQPLFMNFRPRDEEATLIDNVCYTFFPLPDDQFTYVLYQSTVYRDGSSRIESDIVTDVQLGVFRASSPYCTFKDYVLGYAGCDTFVMYRCYLSSGCRSKVDLFTFGLSQSCKQISISCLQKIEDIIEGNGIPEQDYIALPMKLPTECVFEPICTFKGEVHNQIGIHQGELINPAKEQLVYEEPDIHPMPIEDLIKHPSPVVVEEVIHQPYVVEEIHPVVVEEIHPVVVEEYYSPVYVEEIYPPVYEEVYAQRPYIVEETISREPVTSFYTYEGYNPLLNPVNKYRPQPRPLPPPRPGPFYPQQARPFYGNYR